MAVFVDDPLILRRRSAAVKRWSRWVGGSAFLAAFAKVPLARCAAHYRFLLLCKHQDLQNPGSATPHQKFNFPFVKYGTMISSYLMIQTEFLASPSPAANPIILRAGQSTLLPTVMSWLVVLAIAVVGWFGWQKLNTFSHHGEEPPLIPSKIPWIGHLIGLLRHGSRYYAIVRFVSSFDRATRAMVTRI